MQIPSISALATPPPRFQIPCAELHLAEELCQQQHSVFRFCICSD
jgi:hypothetical protein